VEGGKYGEPLPPYTHTNTFKAAAMLMRIKLTTFSTEFRIHNTETNVHKITNIPVFYMALALNTFDAGKSITRTIGRGWLYLLPFQGSKMSQFSETHPSLWPSKWICMHQNN
jgi:hypothetical protein